MIFIYICATFIAVKHLHLQYEHREIKVQTTIAILAFYNFRKINPYQLFAKKREVFLVCLEDVFGSSVFTKCSVRLFSTHQSPEAHEGDFKKAITWACLTRAGVAVHQWCGWTLAGPDRCQVMRLT